MDEWSAIKGTVIFEEQIILSIFAASLEKC